MTSYRLTRIFSISNGNGREHVQFAGPGWTETGQRVAAHLAVGVHTFAAELDGSSFRLQLGTGPDGSRTILAVDDNGTTLSLDELAARLPGPQPIRQPQRMPTRQTWWQRLVPSVSFMAHA